VALIVAEEDVGRKHVIDSGKLDLVVSSHSLCALNHPDGKHQMFSLRLFM
jgi:hypothetical protein